MKSRRFFFSIVTVAVILGVFFFLFFGIVKPRFQGVITPVADTRVVAVAQVGRVVDAVGNVDAHSVEDSVVVVDPVVAVV